MSATRRPRHDPDGSGGADPRGAPGGPDPAPGRRAVLGGAVTGGAALGGAMLSRGSASAAPAVRSGTPDRTSLPIDVAEIAARRYGADAGWFRANTPFVDLPDTVIQDTYYYRWLAFSEHLRSTDVGTLVTEFLPSVSWEGRNSTIAAAVGHQLHELRWVHDPAPMADELDWWLGGSGDLRQYSTWIGESLVAAATVAGDPDLAYRHVDAVIANLVAWQANLDVDRGLYWIAPTTDATEFTTAALDVGDGWAGDSFRPTLNSYLYADHLAVSRIAAFRGDAATARTHAATAAALKQRVQAALWNPGFGHFMDRFSSRYPERYFQFASGPELAGFVPWAFDLPDPRFDVAWAKLRDPRAFGGAHGLRTVPPDSPYYLVQHRTPGQIPGECEWNGPSWPYQTSQVLTGMANLLHAGRDAVVDRADYHAVLHQYAAQQRKDGVPYVAEDLDPDTGAWIADFPDRSEDYNHSTFADLVITGLLGIRPAADDTLRIRPLVPADWTHFALANVPYHGRVVDVVYDRDGGHYPGTARGLSVWVDGARVVTGAPAGGVDVAVHGRRPTPVARTVNYAYAPKGLGPAIASASSTAAGHRVADVDDGRSWTRARPRDRWVSAPSDRTPSVTVELPGTLDITSFSARVLDDGASIRAPRDWHLDTWDGTRWNAVSQDQVRVGLRTPQVANATVVLDHAVRTSRVRLRFTARPGSAVGVADFAVLGPRGQRTTPRFPGIPAGAQLHEAEAATVRGARVTASGEATASGGGYVGGIDGTGSGVSFEAIAAPAAGPATLGIRYANGTADVSTHRLTVDGVAAGVVAYPPTGGWGASGSWGISLVPVVLAPGGSVVDLARGDGFAELDVVWVQG